MKKFVITILVIVGIILASFGSMYIYSNNSKNEGDDLNTKVEKEIDYLNNTIISVMNGLNNIHYANYKIVEKEVAAESEEDKGSAETAGEGQGEGGDSQGGKSQGGGSQGGSSQGGKSQESSNTITNMNMNYSSILVNSSKKIDWEEIKKEVEKLHSTWPTILIDLNALNINKDNLLNFNEVLNNATIAVQKEDKIATAKELANLYTLLVSYTNEYSNNAKTKYILETKANILKAYALAEEKDKWNDMKNSIKQAQNVYNNLMNNNVISNNDISGLNQSYVLLNELEKCIDKKDKNIFYINYKNLMQELEILEK